MNTTGFRTETLPADVVGVRNLVAATGYFNTGEVDIAAELVAEFLEKGAASGYEFLYADHDGHLAGYACWGLIPCTVASWDLYWISVHPAQQGTGLGRRILDEMERRVREAGGTAVYAETSGRPQYASTRAFYLRCGYQLGAEFEDFYAPGDPKVVFIKKL
jgi:GNAT superfamily N-acetyltransferase